MNTPSLKELLQQFESRLTRLEKLVEEVRDELRGRHDLPQKDIYLETLDRTLSRLIKQWLVTIRHALNAPEPFTDQKDGDYIQLEFVLGHARGLGREFDLDTSWSGSDNRLKRLISDVSITALAALFCVHGIPVSELSGLISNDEIDARISAQGESLVARLQE